MKRLTTFIAGAAVAATLGGCQQPAVSGWKSFSGDKNIERRVDSVLSLMTLEKKVGQMAQYSCNWDVTGPVMTGDYETLLKQGLVGSLFNVYTVDGVRKMQEMALSESRLKIPVLFGYDVVHGYRTIFPMPLAESCSWDLERMRKSAAIAADEASASGIAWTFAPMVDISRDARWGRVGETFGEDPYLVTRMGVATIKGFQGKDCQGTEVALACAKHLIAGSEPSNGTNAAPMDVSERTLREVYLPPYKAAVEEANVFTLMAAHNELNGIPCHADQWMMTDIMRGEYGFNGFIVSDWMDVDRIYDLHYAALTLKDAFYETIDAGLDMRMHGPDFLEKVVELVKEGKLSEVQIDRACSKILEAKFRLGLFENPFVSLEKTAQTLYNKKHLQSALEMAEESIVLLKNENNLLPLDFSDYKNILVTGPNANNHTILGDWTLQQPDANVVTILDGIREIAGSAKVNYYDYGDDVRQNSMDKVNEAAAIAKKSDLAIVVVGENPLRYQKSKTCGENIDRMGLELLGTQNQLVQKIHETGVPTIVVLVGGRPLSVNWIAQNVQALVQAWEPGSLGGRALANILTGKVNPSAKLPISIPRHSGQIQMIYNHKPSQYFHKYIDGPSTPLYPFGFGLSYTRFDYSGLKLSHAKISVLDSFTASIELTNVGNREGTEVVQLYIRDVYSSATRPVKELKDFTRVTLKPGEKKTVTFTVTPDKLAYWNRNMQYGVEKGEFEIMIGSSSQDKDLKKVKIEVI